MGRQAIWNRNSYGQAVLSLGFESLDFVDMRTKVPHRCVACDHTFFRVPSAFFRSTGSSTGCPNCSSGRRVRTRASYNLEIKHLSLECVAFSGMDHKSKHRCLNCGDTFFRRPAAVLSGLTVCVACKAARIRCEYFNLLKGLRIDCVGFHGISKPCTHVCQVCGHEWQAQPRSIRDLGTGCSGSCAQDKRIASCYMSKTVRIGRRTVIVQGYEPSALEYLRARGCNMRKLAFTSLDGKPRIPYVFDGRERTYTPDFYHTGKRAVIEVKSLWTLFGKSEVVYDTNRAKAMATLQAGYRFSMLVFDSNGARIALPSNWYKKSAAALRRILERQT